MHVIPVGISLLLTLILVVVALMLPIGNKSKRPSSDDNQSDRGGRTGPRSVASLDKEEIISYHDGTHRIAQ